MSRLHREAMGVLIEEIVGGDPPPGEMLPKEVALAERFDISRGVARECIRGLEERGLIAVRHGRGATVRDRADWDVFDEEVATALAAGPDGRRLRAEARECQRLVEVEAAGLAALRARQEHIDELARAIDSMAAAGSRAGRGSAAASRAGRGGSAAERYRDANADFHRAVVRAAGNRMLARMSEPLHRALATTGAEKGDRNRRIAEHERILTAIATGDADGARAAMIEHLATGAGRRNG
jgi:DNA-binding FadR family transcriptional regulator